jgi:tRNA (mo5U34)-methyltransferase
VRYNRTVPDRDAVVAAVASVPYWYHRIEVAPGVVTPGVNNCQSVLDVMGLPASLAGMRVLDLGARDGFFSFECERRGAEVVALDYIAGGRTGFDVARDLLGSKLQMLHENAYNVTPEKHGTFDIVLLLGLLYHLRDPLFVLDAVRRVCRQTLYVETAIWPENSSTPMMRFHPADEMNSDFTNYWTPNPACLRAMLAEADFEVRRYQPLGSRALAVATVGLPGQPSYYAKIARGLVE